MDGFDEWLEDAAHQPIRSVEISTERGHEVAFYEDAPDYADGGLLVIPSAALPQG